MICQKFRNLLGIFENWIEFTGFIFGVACVVLAMRNHIINWPLAIVSSLFYLVFFWEGGLYSDSGLQVVFVGASIWGWINWNRMNKLHATQRRISRLSHEQITQVAAITLMAWWAWYWVFVRITDTATAPFLDTLTTCISISAVILQAQRKLECWIWWFIANSIFVPLYISRGYHATAGLYVILWVLSIMGFLSWRKEFKES